MPGFDPEKRSRTIEDRGLDFIDALALFDGRPMGDDGKFYSVIWTWRQYDLWIISFRRAHNDEARKYREYVG